MANPESIQNMIDGVDVELRVLERAQDTLGVSTGIGENIDRLNIIRVVLEAAKSGQPCEIPLQADELVRHPRTITLDPDQERIRVSMTQINKALMGQKDAPFLADRDSMPRRIYFDLFPEREIGN